MSFSAWSSIAGQAGGLVAAGGSHVRQHALDRGFERGLVVVGELREHRTALCRRMGQHPRHFRLAGLARQLVRARVEEFDRGRAQRAVLAQELDQGERLRRRREALQERQPRAGRRHQLEGHVADHAEGAFAADEQVQHVAARHEAVADGVLGVRLGNRRQVRGAAIVPVGQGEGITRRAIAAAAERQGPAGRQLHGEPHHPVARRAEAQRPRPGGVGRHHPAHRRAGFGGIERQRPAGCVRGQVCLQVVQRRPGQGAHGRWIPVQVERHHAPYACHRDEVRGAVGHRTAGHAGARAAHGDPVPVGRMPPQHLAQLVHRGRLGHRHHRRRRHAGLVAQQIGDVGQLRGEAEARRRGGRHTGQVARLEDLAHVSRGCASARSSAAPRCGCAPRRTARG